MGKKILHVFPSFAAGGIQLRLGNLVPDMPQSWTHEIFATDGDYAAWEAVEWPENTSIAQNIPNISGGLVARLMRLRGVLKAARPDLLVTYNWGSIEWAMAARTLKWLPHIHNESGFSAQEALQRLPRRNRLRQFTLPGAKSLIVCSQTLETLAQSEWKLPKELVKFIPDGIEVERFSGASANPDYAAFDGKDADAVVIGCVAPLRPEKNLTALLDAFELAAQRSSKLYLSIAGDGGERARLEAHAAALPNGDRVKFCGFLADIERFYPAIDMCALSSDTEQLPNSILQAMAAAQPIAAFGVGDIPHMVAVENQPYICARRDITALSDAFLSLAGDAEARKTIGKANRARCAAVYQRKDMADAYAKAFADAMGEQL